MQHTDHGDFPGLLRERRKRRRECAGAQAENDFSARQHAFPWVMVKRHSHWRIESAGDKSALTISQGKANSSHRQMSWIERGLAA